MSTFTQFNGPQGSSGPSTKDITALIDAYNQLSIKLTAHIEALAPTDSTVHGIVNYVTDIKTQLETLIGAKAGNSDLKDVRTIAEYNEGHIPNAICIPNETIGSNTISELPDKEQLILVYCRSGNRSVQASEKLADLGYSNIKEFGGINTWNYDTE